MAEFYFDYDFDAEHDELKPFILQWEGGYVNHPNDPGGHTNRGVTLAAYEAYCRLKGLPKPSVAQLKALSDAQWTEVFKTMYWDRWKADKIVNQRVANILVDWVWASGVYGIKRPQKLIGVKQDGVVGSVTLSRLNDMATKNPSALIQALLNDRRKFVDEIIARNPRLAVFRRGWLNRINKL